MRWTPVRWSRNRSDQIAPCIARLNPTGQIILEPDSYDLGQTHGKCEFPLCVRRYIADLLQVPTSEWVGMRVTITQLTEVMCRPDRLEVE